MEPGRATSWSRLSRALDSFEAGCIAALALGAGPRQTVKRELKDNIETGATPGQEHQ